MLEAIRERAEARGRQGGRHEGVRRSAAAAKSSLPCVQTTSADAETTLRFDSHADSHAGGFTATTADVGGRSTGISNLRWTLADGGGHSASFFGSEGRGFSAGCGELGMASLPDASLIGSAAGRGRPPCSVADQVGRLAAASAAEIGHLGGRGGHSVASLLTVRMSSRSFAWH